MWTPIIRSCIGAKDAEPFNVASGVRLRLTKQRVTAKHGILIPNEPSLA